jgi:hypothetical protein
MRDDVNEMEILRVGSGFFCSKILLTAIDFGLFTALGGGARTGEEIGAELGLHQRGIWDFLDTLVALGFLERDGDGTAGRYRNSASTGRYLDKNKPTYIGGMLEMWNQRLYGFWDDLGTALRTGEPQNEVKHARKPMFEVLYADQNLLEQFLISMEIISRRNFEAFAEKFDFSRYKTLSDVGGARALLSRIAAQRHPHLQCTSFDLPQVEPIAARAVAQDLLSDRIRTVAGDFFKDAIPAADVITMGMVLHNWNLEKKLHLIRLAYEALPPGGAFVSIENMIDDARRSNVGGLVDSLQMLIDFGDAFNCTFAEFSAWCRDAGFKRCEQIHLAGGSSAAIAYK